MATTAETLVPEQLWLVGYRRLQIRYERHADILTAFLHLAGALICFKTLHTGRSHEPPP